MLIDEEGSLEKAVSYYIPGKSRSRVVEGRRYERVTHLPLIKRPEELAHYSIE
jgi:hypothetical protein